MKPAPPVTKPRIYAPPACLKHTLVGPEGACPERSEGKTRNRLPFEPAEHEAGVLPPESEAVLQDDPDIGLPLDVGDVVQVALGVRVFVVDRRVDGAGLERLHAGDRLERARRAERMADHRL